MFAHFHSGSLFVVCCFGAECDLLLYAFPLFAEVCSNLNAKSKHSASYYLHSYTFMHDKESGQRSVKIKNISESEKQSGEVRLRIRVSLLERKRDNVKTGEKG